jgi:hypothetical protein
MKLQYALELALSFEQVMHRLYTDLSKHSSSADSDLRKLWTLMAAAETLHAQTWDEIQRRLTKRELDKEIALSPKVIDLMVASTERFRKALAEPTVDLDTIFRFVLAVESGEQNAVLLGVLQHAPAEIADRIQSDIAEPSRAHILPVLNAIKAASRDPELLELVGRSHTVTWHPSAAT